MAPILAPPLTLSATLGRMIPSRVCVRCVQFPSEETYYCYTMVFAGLLMCQATLTFGAQHQSLHTHNPSLIEYHNTPLVRPLVLASKDHPFYKQLESYHDGRLRISFPGESPPDLIVCVYCALGNALRAAHCAVLYTPARRWACVCMARIYLALSAWRTRVCVCVCARTFE